MGRMPLIKVYSSAPPLTKVELGRLLSRLSREVARLLQKPERYVMTCMMPPVEMTFGGDERPAAYAEIKSIGVMAPETTAEISASLCALLAEALGVDQDRIYIEFQDAERHLWGFNGGTFA